MRKALFTFIVFTACSIVTKAQSQKADHSYDDLVDKDIVHAMKVLNIKDTTGKTFHAFAPQIEKEKEFLLVKLDNGDQLVFDEKNKFRAVFFGEKKPW